MIYEQIKVGKRETFDAKNPILAKDVIGYEVDTFQYKVGDGTTSYSDLPYHTHTGTDGKDGESAYDIAAELGFEGTEEEWLESLKAQAPIKGTDYFTDEEIDTIEGEIIDELKELNPYTPYIDKDTGCVFACGTAITISAEDDDNTKITWYDNDTSSNKSLTFPNGYLIYGGGDGRDHEVNYPATSIIFDSGKVKQIQGGNLAAGTVGVATVVMNGGSFTEQWNGVAGGGQSYVDGITYKNLTGRAVVIINNTEEDGVGTVYGAGGSGYSVVGETEVILNGGYVKYLTAAGSNGTTLNAKMTIYDGKVDVAQGCNRGRVENINIDVYGGDITALYAGGEIDTSVTATYNNARMTVYAGNIEKVSAGNNGGVEDDSKAHILNLAV